MRLNMGKKTYIGIGLFALVGLVALFVASRTDTVPMQNKNASFAPPVVDDKPRAEPRTEPGVEDEKLLLAFKGKDVTRVETDAKIIVLTFDGGGNADGTQKVIDTLAAQGVPATFFLTGNYIEQFPEATDAIVKFGGEVANHTLSHKDFTTLSKEQVTQEIVHMQEIALAHDITVVPFFRFPYGSYKKEDVALVNKLDYIAVRWTVDSLGWQGNKDGHDAKFVTGRVLSKAIPGAIVLMHLGSAPDKTTLDADALPDIITALKNQGYRLVTLSELFSAAL